MWDLVFSQSKPLSLEISSSPCIALLWGLSTLCENNRARRAQAAEPLQPYRRRSRLGESFTGALNGFGQGNLSPIRKLFCGPCIFQKGNLFRQGMNS